MTPSAPNSRKSGFALIITLSMMILLTLLAVGLLSVSTVALRTSGQSSALQQARANARLAMMLAVGELQTHMGPDQRVSADAAILDPSTVTHPHWMGAWDSWQAGSSTGVDPASEHRTIMPGGNAELAPTYEPNRKDHFRSWLVSLDPQEAGSVDTPLNLSLSGTAAPDKNSNAVRLVGTGSLGTTGDPNDFVAARLISLRSTPSSAQPSGRYGWWVGDESQKARIVGDSYEIAETAPKSLAENIFRHQAPGSTGTKSVPGLETVTDESQLARAPSLQSLDLVSNAQKTVSHNFHHITPYSQQVLSDGREGGLKRDLSTLLERPINASETSDEFMLYRFDNAGEERVPIQDISAFYQLYRERGVKYSSSLLPSGIQISNPDFKSVADFQREYSNLYRMPVPIKVQLLLSLIAVPRAPSEIGKKGNNDTHKLHIGMSPAVTLWNPYNVPLVMNKGDAAKLASRIRFYSFPFSIRWNKNDGQYSSPHSITLTTLSGQDGDTVFSLFFSGKNPIEFQPGEVIVFSPEKGDLSKMGRSNSYDSDYEMKKGWDPNKFITMARSEAPSPSGANHTPTHIEGTNKFALSLTFKGDDRLSFTIEPKVFGEQALNQGSGLKFYMIQAGLSAINSNGAGMARHFQLASRLGDEAGGVYSNEAFNTELIRKGFPNEAEKIEFPNRSGSGLIASGGDPLPFLLVNLAAGCETDESANGGSYAGRRFPSRPFLHSTPITGNSFIDRADNDSLYHHGWNWWVEPINSVFDANISVSGNNSYYGGGYTPESGSTHVVQQEIPVVPPISIAALSHAHLGGFSLATGSVNHSGENTTANGQGGLFPHTLQAIGNSYAHPYLKPGEAFGQWSRQFDEDKPSRNVTLADHSYLANKALWDDYFFSSISPGNTEIFRPASSTAEQIAKRFFFEGQPLPNRRVIPYTENLDEDKLTELYNDPDEVTDGLADRIAAHLLVEGPFNVNSTSVDAWKTFLSSLKSKNISFLDKDSALTSGVKLGSETPQGTPVSSFSLPNGKTYAGSRNDPADPAQWTDWRELSDKEITELATAMVKQVKLRGPFLSLSEFVNRRLDPDKRELSVKGALQAALDDPDVSINSGFRNASRRFSSEEMDKMNPEFVEALEGPIAYGSAAYVDQADILRNIGNQLTPRGDTFVIRSYGDALDASGNVQARAWCEAVVQRVPLYLNPGEDSAHLKQSALEDGVNQKFGRRLRIVSFRFLSEAEI